MHYGWHFHLAILHIAAEYRYSWSLSPHFPQHDLLTVIRLEIAAGVSENSEPE